MRGDNVMSVVVNFFGGDWEGFGMIGVAEYREEIME